MQIFFYSKTKIKRKKNEYHSRFFRFPVKIAGYVEFTILQSSGFRGISDQPPFLEQSSTDTIEGLTLVPITLLKMLHVVGIHLFFQILLVNRTLFCYSYSATGSCKVLVQCYRYFHYGIFIHCVIDLVMYKGKEEKYTRRINTTKKIAVLIKIPHNCVSNATENEIKIQKCGKRIQKNVAVPVRKIFQEEMSEIDFTAVEHGKSTLCLERRKDQELHKIQQTAWIYYLKMKHFYYPSLKVYYFQKHLNDTGRRILVFADDNVLSP